MSELDQHVELTGPGTDPFVFTAPHDKTHHRLDNNELIRKMSEPGTGALARFLAAELGGTAAVNISDSGDANWDASHPLKDILLRDNRITSGTYLLDLHGMLDKHGIDIAIGPGRFPERSESLVDPLASSLRDNGFNVLVDREGRFAARGEHRVTSWAQSHGADAVQIEISSSLRRLKLDNPRHVELQRAFLGPLIALKTDRD
jgi:phage replication-related protein YjqB (UPF0714/DUF867 family)